MVCILCQTVGLHCQSPLNKQNLMNKQNIALSTPVLKKVNSFTLLNFSSYAVSGLYQTKIVCAS
jgi:hypothetical protein